MVRKTRIIINLELAPFFFGASRQCDERAEPTPPSEAALVETLLLQVTNQQSFAASVQR
jgi:hypothetical protein